MIEQQMEEARFGFVTDADKQFIIGMTNALTEQGYTYDGLIGDGICWGRYMLIFRKAGLKSKRLPRASIFVKAPWLFGFF